MGAILDAACAERAITHAVFCGQRGEEGAAWGAAASKIAGAGFAGCAGAEVLRFDSQAREHGIIAGDSP